MVDIRLKDGQTGYDVVAEYVKRYWDKHYVCTVIVGLGVHGAGSVHDLISVIATPDDECEVEFLHDWWIGQDSIRIIGIMSVDEVNVTGGVYEKDRLD